MMAAGQRRVSVLRWAPAWILEPKARESKALAVEPGLSEDEPVPPEVALDWW
jgi:hypothetical protein